MPKSVIKRVFRQLGYSIIPVPKDIESSASSSGEWKVGFLGVNFDDAHYFVPEYAQHRPAAQAILRHQYHEPKTHELIKHLTQSRKGEILHAGAFFGDMLPSFSRACPQHSVICFEPVLENYILARLCVKTNNLENVILYNAALSDKSHNVCMSTRDTETGVHRGGSSFISDSGDLVPTLSIDQFDFKNLICIQLDVEGHELQALQGARKTIAQHNPIVLIEDNNKSCSGFLLSIDYRHIATIPGLDIWYSSEQNNILDGFDV